MRRHSCPPVGQGWREMDTAPRDGTIVELCCTYGVAPWYGLFRWDGLPLSLLPKSGGYAYMLAGRNGEPGSNYGSGGGGSGSSSEQRWRSPDGNSGVCADDEYLRWRPYTGSISGYVDPTRGEQDTREYWLRACR